MIAIVGALFTISLIANIAYSSESHHSIVYVDIPAETIVTNSYMQQGIALAAASGQHHYKATNQLQWSAAGAYSDMEDDSAVSFGLAKQLGKVFVTGSFSSDGNHNIIGFNASGTF